MPKLSSIPDIVSDLSQGRMCLLVDGENRENEGDLVACAATITPEQVNFMATHGRGLICLAMSKAETERLNLVPMVQHNQCQHRTNFMVSIDAREGITTGISAYDRARTLRLASCSSSTERDFSSPGHVFPLGAKVGGIFKREGHTEAAVELSVLAGQGECAVICEVMDEDGTMMRLQNLIKFAKAHNIKIGSIKDLKKFLLNRTK